MNVSVVIATYNRRDILRRTLESVASQSHAAHEVIIADDGSTDGTPELAAEFPQVTFLRQENRGSSAARNLGVQRATGDVVAFTDDDCVVPPDWLERIVDGYERHPEVAGGGGYLLMIAKDEQASQRIRNVLTECPPNDRARFVNISVSETGLEITRS